MKKILIISYFFPPANFAASYRIFSWAKDLHKHGYYPVIVTRKFDTGINNYIALSVKTSEGLLHEKNEFYEVYSLPYKGNLKDRLLNKYGQDKMVLLRKILSFFELFFQNFCISLIPFHNLYSFSKKLLKAEKYDLIVTSGRPFILFKLCDALHKRFNVPWVADYRDPWSTDPWIKKNGILSRIDRFFEKKWVGSAEAIISVSEVLSREIGLFVNRQWFVVYNGFEKFYEKIKNPAEEIFTIVHNGSLYNSQKIEIFAEALKKFIDLKGNPDLRVLFLGISVDDEQNERIHNIFNDYETYIGITKRLQKMNS